MIDDAIFGGGPRVGGSTTSPSSVSAKSVPHSASSRCGRRLTCLTARAGARASCHGNACTRSFRSSTTIATWWRISIQTASESSLAPSIATATASSTSMISCSSAVRRLGGRSYYLTYDFWAAMRPVLLPPLPLLPATHPVALPIEPCLLHSAALGALQARALARGLAGAQFPRVLRFASVQGLPGPLAWIEYDGRPHPPRRGARHTHTRARRTQ